MAEDQFTHRGSQKRALTLLSPLATPEPQPAESISGESSQEHDKPVRKRKKHTKSRLGCFPCKTRKIKCDESRPSCSQCVERRLKCTYPNPSEVGPAIVSRLQAEGASSPVHAVSLSTTGQNFSMTDMQAFHAFLFKAYPNQPFGNDKIWRTRIPSIAFKNEYLMHAMLSQGAIFLNDNTEQSFIAEAVNHRLLAVSGLKQALAKFELGDCTEAERDSLIASMWLISWQSLYFPDAIDEFRTLERGAAIILRKLWEEKLNTSFVMKRPEDLQDWCWSEYGECPPIDTGLIRLGLESFDRLKPLCVTESHKKLHNTLSASIKELSLDPFGAVSKGAAILIAYAEMSTPAFLSFVDPNNNPSRLLSAHINAFYLLILPIVNGEWREKSKPLPRPALTNAIQSAIDSLGPLMSYHMEWPDEVRRRTLNANGGWPFAPQRHPKVENLTLQQYCQTSRV